MGILNNEIVAELASKRTVEHFTEVLGPDIQAQDRLDIAQETYIVLLTCKNLVSIYVRGKILDYAFSIVRNKIAKFYVREKNAEYDDARHVAAPEESTDRWYE